VQVAKQMAVQLLTANDQLERYLKTTRESHLLPFLDMRRQLETALAEAQELSSDNARELREISAQERAERRFVDFARREIAAQRAKRRVVGQESREAAVADFVAANGRYQRVLDSVRAEEVHEAALVPVTTIAIINGLSALIAAVLGSRRLWAMRARRRADDARAAAELAYTGSQSRFAEALQVAENQDESHHLLTTHLERWLPDATVKVLIRNNSGDRLEAAVPLASDDPIAKGLDQAAPRSCLGVRLSRPVRQGTGSDEVLTCGICGALDGQSTCQPLLVGGEVIGSVLATQDRRLNEEEERRIRDSVTQAAPVLANLRNLSLAERRASTDPLTGLPNKRGLEDSFKRMMAHASRSLTVLSAVVIDLDHFKHINDNFGHDRGDEVLAAFGVMLRSNLREADLAARSGGEEFIVLLPDTDRAGALRVAEHLRLATKSLVIPELPRLTASFGVATFPEDALDGETLLRVADRALYAAKQRGRDRVEIASSAGLSPRPDDEQTQPTAATTADIEPAS
jgi:diguanylate cyclase (GGDEF)-like protein